MQQRWMDRQEPSPWASRNRYCSGLEAVLGKICSADPDRVYYGGAANNCNIGMLLLDISVGDGTDSLGLNRNQQVSDEQLYNLHRQFQLLVCFLLNNLKTKEEIRSVTIS